MKVQEIMSSQVESIAPTASLRQAARKMSNLGIGSLPVIQDGTLLGIITADWLSWAIPVAARRRS